MRKIISIFILFTLIISLFYFFPVVKNKEISLSMKKILFSPNINDSEYTIILFESFEKSEFPPPQWEKISKNMNFGWQLDNINTNSENFSACCRHDPDGNPQNEWIITPSINLTDYYELQLSFHWFMSYFWSVYPYDNYDFAVYLNNNETDWIQLWNEEQVGLFENWIWYNTSKGETVDLSLYGGQNNIRIGFQYNGSDGAKLNLDDICVYGKKITNPLTVNAGGPYFGYIGVPIYFYGDVTGGESPYEWLWDFGDGNQSRIKNPTHFYNAIGNYSVILKVTDALKISDSDKTIAQINNMSKIPELVIKNISGVYGLHATIINEGCVDATNIHWQIRINNKFLNHITIGNISCIKKKCYQQINSTLFKGFGLVTINILIDADNMERISKQCSAFIIGNFVFLLH